MATPSVVRFTVKKKMGFVISLKGIVVKFFFSNVYIHLMI